MRTPTPDDVMYRAMLARDPRFDGKFFVGVKTTGIYCRPICPARPKRENVVFYPHRLAAERAGYRPCLRCRPESAPESPAWLGTSAMVRRAIRLIDDIESLGFNEDEFAERFGVTARHLRRVFQEEVGKTPKQLATENRLNLARKLVVETKLPLGEVAFAAGFSSVRRFNDAFKDRFKRGPREVRGSKTPLSGEGLTVTLSYRPPFDFNGMLQFYTNHAVGRLETVIDGCYTRVVHHEGETGRVIVRDDPAQSRLVVTVDFPTAAPLHGWLTRVRHMFDLGADPVLVGNALEKDPAVRRMLVRRPGIRLPSGWDPFETGVSIILGQLVTVMHGKNLVADLTELMGKDSGLRDANGAMIKLFPTPQAVAEADLRALKTTGVRRQALQAFARAVVVGEVSLAATQDEAAFRASILAIKGLGRWTADYMALKVIRHTDAFPETDLVVARALSQFSTKKLSAMAPWRGYVAALLWLGHYEE